jgi:carbamoyl-phosphate synthase large subunit
MGLTIGVSGINAVDNPGPGIGVARSLREAKDLDVRIIGLAYDAMEPGIFMDWVIDDAFLLPYPSAGHDVYRERLLQVREKTGLDFIIPTLDTEMPFYMKNGADLAANGIVTFVPTPGSTASVARTGWASWPARWSCGFRRPASSHRRPTWNAPWTRSARRSW